DRPEVSAVLRFDAGWVAAIESDRLVLERMVGMARANAREVRPDASGKWRVIKPGGQRSSANFETQAAAIARAREILERNGGGELRVAGRDGAIRQADTIGAGNDPVRSR